MMDNPSLMASQTLVDFKTSWTTFYRTRAPQVHPDKVGGDREAFQALTNTNDFVNGLTVEQFANFKAQQSQGLIPVPAPAVARPSTPPPAPDNTDSVQDGGHLFS